MCHPVALSYKPCLVGMLPGGHAVILAKPLSELLEHARHRSLPPCALVARVIKTLALSIFRWHFHDHILVPVEGGWYGSFGFKKRESMQEIYPYLIDKALTLRFKSFPTRSNLFNNTYFDSVFGGNFNISSVVDYYRDYHKIEIIPETQRPSIRGLINSKALYASIS